MPNGVRDMGFNTATNLFLTLGMPSYPLPPNPKLGCTIYDDYKRVWVVWNGSGKVDIVLNEQMQS